MGGVVRPGRIPLPGSPTKTAQRRVPAGPWRRSFVPVGGDARRASFSPADAPNGRSPRSHAPASRTTRPGWPREPAPPIRVESAMTLGPSGWSARPGGSAPTTSASPKPEDPTATAAETRPGWAPTMHPTMTTRTTCPTTPRPPWRPIPFCTRPAVRGAWRSIRRGLYRRVVPRCFTESSLPLKWGKYL